MLVPLALSISEHLSVLAQAEEDSSYYEKAEQILDILFDGEENDVIASFRARLKERKAFHGN